ncbi:MAG: translation initiation factor IF-2 [Oscillospiraceae bacterium]|jgi:translation initiation factor IF-2|nr:translation initiation factor IF-2 [Oscillospiraceae bacterium]
MSTIFKYKINDLSKDLGLQNKAVMALLNEYGITPKNHQHTLSARELDIIFARLTKDNQVANLGEIFLDTTKSKPAKAKAEPAKTETTKPEPTPEVPATPEVTEVPAATEKPAKPKETTAQPAAQATTQTAAPQKAPQNQKSPQNQKTPAPRPSATQPQSKVGQRPAQQQSTQPKVDQPRLAKQEKPDKPYVPRQIAEKRVIDTSGATINIEKYDDRLDRLVPQRAENMKRGKEKIVKRQDRQRTPTVGSGAKRRTEERDRLQRLQREISHKVQLKVSIPDEISVGELAIRMKKSGAEVVKQLLRNGIRASLGEIIDYDTAALIAEDMGCRVEREVVVTIEEKLIDDHDDDDADLEPRAPVVVVMGHVDHGKTSLLDKIREANVASGEAGGITQHIGAYRVAINGSPITFLDTPGHEAFTAMRARGAQVTDIAILVVAADDGIMPQTIESINHAKAANIPIIVAVNKMDLPGANPDRIKQQLTEHGLVSDEWGGDTTIVPVSAKTGDGVETLLEMVALTAEMAELRANPERLARGTIIEARLDKGRGPIMTVLVQNGTLHQGDTIIAGTAVGRVRVMTNDRGERVTEAKPSVPVEIAGMSEVPEAGEPFNAVQDERLARELAEQRREERRNQDTGEVKVSIDNLFEKIGEGDIKELNLIVKADVQGSAEAIKTSLEKLSGEEVRVRVIHSAVGAISDSDVMLAATSGAIIIGFNVRPDNAARDSATRSGVDIRLHSVIYNAIDEVTAAIRGMQAPKYRAVEYGKAEVRMVYKVSKVGTICGCYVTEGKVVRGCDIRVIRDGVVIHTGPLASLRRFKDDVREVATNYECGMQLEKYNDVREGDILEAFGEEEIK